MSAISKEVADAEIEELSVQKPWGTRMIDTIRRKPPGSFRCNYRVSYDYYGGSGRCDYPL